MSRFTLVFLLACALSVPGLAQTTGVAGSNDLTINGAGSGGTSPVFNPTVGAGGQVAFGVSAAPGDAVVGITGSGSVPGLFPLPSMTSVDVGLTPFGIIVDGTQTLGFPVSTVVPASGNWALSIPVALPVGAFDIQFAVLGGAFAGGVATTQAHTSTAPPVINTSYTLGDDDFTAHSLATPITFYGVAYNQIFFGSNGHLTFGTGSTDFTETMPDFFNGFGNAAPNPGVAVCYSDLNRGGTTSGTTYDVNEDTILGITTFSFTNANHWSSQEAAGTFTCQFLGAGSLNIDYNMFTNATTSTDGIIVGVSDGDSSVGADVDRTGLGLLGYSAMAPGESIGELFAPNVDPTPTTAMTAGVFQFVDLGAGNGTYTIF